MDLQRGNIDQERGRKGSRGGWGRGGREGEDGMSDGQEGGPTVSRRGSVAAERVQKRQRHRGLSASDEGLAPEKNRTADAHKHIAVRRHLAIAQSSSMVL